METLISPNAIWLLDAVADGITIQSPAGPLVYANPAAARAVGFETPKQMLATPPDEILASFQLFDEYDNPLPLEQLPGRRALKGETENERLVQFRFKNGDIRWSMIKAQPVYNPDGTIRYAVNVWHDVTERMERQRALEISSAQLEETAAELEATISELELRTDEAETRAERERFLAEAGRMLATTLETESTLRMIAHLAVPRIADWVSIRLLNDEGILEELEIAHADPAMLRYARDLQRKFPPDPRNDRAYDVVRSGVSELYATIPEELLEAGAQNAEHLDIIRTLKLRSAMVVPMKARDVVVGVISFIRVEGSKHYTEDDLDFAESLAARSGLALANARLYRDAQEANRVKSDFLAIMSHELRTPLTAIFGYTELLTTGVVGELTDAQRAHLDRVHASAAHLLSIIEDILSYARTEAGRDQVHATRVRLPNVVADAINIVKPNAVKKGLQLITDVADDMELKTDVAKLRQVLINLLGNAVKFTESGSITVRARKIGTDILLEVEDTGMGIDPEDFERIFEPFRQLEPSMTRTSGGTGLGLAVSKRFVELLGGRIEVSSQRGIGTLFTITLPLEPPA